LEIKKLKDTNLRNGWLLLVSLSSQSCEPTDRRHNKITTNKQNINIPEKVPMSTALPPEAACLATPLTGFNHKACISHEPTNLMQK